MTAAPTLSTDRLTLRPLRMSDHAAYLGFVTGERARHMGGPYGPGTAWTWLVNDAGQWALQGFGGLAVTSDGAMVGQVAVTQGVEFPEPQLGWFLLDGFDGNGYATEAAEAMRAWVIAQGRVASLVSYIDPANDASARLARRLGATRDPGAATLPNSVSDVWRHAVSARNAA